MIVSAVATSALVAALLGDRVAAWARIPAGLVVSATVAAGAAALALALERHAVFAGRRGRRLALHAAVALLTTVLGTALVYASVRFTQPDAVASFVRGPLYWSAAWWVVLYGLVATAWHAVRERDRLRARELAAAQAELHALRARLDPHFLFNTLHSLGVLVREDRGLAEEALDQFGELMRYVLRTSRAGEDVPLADEIDFVRSYLALEKLRLGDRLRVVEDLDDDALDCSVPPLLVQPLIENAIRHGIAPLRRGGTVELSARHEGGTLTIRVRDDGAGCDAASVARSAGLGLDAVARQLAARFPAEHRFAAGPRPEGGFEVQLSLPASVPGSPVARRPAERRRAS
ncbi:MAG: histidine kinase [Thermodesulfobacteriota bacterium]